MGAGNSQALKFIYKPLGFQNQIDVAGAFRIEVSKYLPVQPGIGHLPFDQVNTRHSVGHTFEFCEFLCNGAGYLIGVQSLLFKDVIVQVNVGVIKSSDKFLRDTVFSFDSLDSPFLVQFVGFKVLRINTEPVQLWRRLGCTVIGGQNDEGLIKPHLFVNKGEQFRQGFVEAQQVVFAVAEKLMDR